MEPKKVAIKHIAYLMNESSRIASEDYIDDQIVNRYFDEVRKVVVYITTNTGVDINVLECLEDVLQQRPRPSFWVRILNYRRQEWGNSSFIEKDLREQIAGNKTALVHLYRAVAREEILSGELPML